MKHRRTYLLASDFVDQMVHKHHANRCWVWEILDAYRTEIRLANKHWGIAEAMWTRKNRIRN